MADFLLELFSEEIPARMQTEAARHLKAAFITEIEQAGIECKSVRSFVTPRRLALIAQYLPEVQPDVTLEKKGPKTSAAQAAIDGFLRSTGLPLEKLEKRMVGKDETYFAVIHQKGQPVATLLKTITEKILGSFPWPKSMRWGNNPARWVRPLRGIVCIFGDALVPVEFAGIKASKITYGHRFMSPQAIAIKNASEYEDALRNTNVIVDQEKRRLEILKQAETVAGENKLSLKRDEGLLNEVTGLVEFPIVLTGTIDEKFMDLPPEVLTSEMRTHQKYFALLGRKEKLASKFLAVSNMLTHDGGKLIIAGNERVLRARLADGRFFFDQDRKKPLEEWANGLKDVTFHTKIGTIAEKVSRIKVFAAALAHYVVGTDQALALRAVTLCKADLVTGMVGEFPELQGVMGRYYALHQKEPAEVADAIRDHYLPLGPESPAPAAPVSICVALADKLDTLTSMFKVGEKPTGSKDPFALRRAALGIIRIILENSLRIPLKKFADDDLLAFFCDRLKVMLRDQGVRHDIIDAVMANGDDDLTRVVARAKALQEFLETYDGKNLLAAYKRTVNILNIEEKKDNTKYTLNVKSDLMQQDEEKALLLAFEKTTPAVIQSLGNENFSGAMSALAALRPPVDNFFDNVMVNADDKAIRSNRLCLLATIRATLDRIADFSLIEG